MTGVVQRTGERFLSQGNRRSEVLLEDRPAPRRFTAAIQGLSIQLPEYKTLTDAVLPNAERTKNGDSCREEEGEESDIDPTPDLDGEDEIPDPNPGPK
jgi:hypothetical protein